MDIVSRQSGRADRVESDRFTSLMDVAPGDFASLVLVYGDTTPPPLGLGFVSSASFLTFCVCIGEGTESGSLDAFSNRAAIAFTVCERDRASEAFDLAGSISGEVVEGRGGSFLVGVFGMVLRTMASWPPSDSLSNKGRRSESSVPDRCPGILLCVEGVLGVINGAFCCFWDCV
jgi:hypothetical protein